MSKIGNIETEVLLSRQVTGARYFFLNLKPRPRAGLVLVMGGIEHCEPEYEVMRAKFPYTSVECIVTGRGWAKIGKQCFDLWPGIVFSYAPSTPHEIHTAPDDVLTKYFVSLAGRNVARRLRQCGLRPGCAVQLSPGVEIAGVFEHLLREGQHVGPHRQAICAALLEVLLLKIADDATFAPEIRGRSHEAFLRCKAYIDAEARNLRTLGDIARGVGAEASSVCRWFRRYQGMSPYQYLLRRRLGLAAERLVEHGGLVKEAAASLGFADPFHFSHRFKAVHGVAPSALLSRVRHHART